MDDIENRIKELERKIEELKKQQKKLLRGWKNDDM